MDLHLGQILAGKFRVEHVLGHGGMGVVVAATHVQLGERVALKFLLPEALENPEAAARFLREARAAVRIKSEHVARVLDVGTLEDGTPYMVMEYLNGLDLSAWLSKRGALPIEQAVDFLLQASEAIAEAHTLGIVHRDLKPANLFVIERPDATLAVKVLDFGISKSLGVVGSHAGAGGALTTTSTLMGSPLYMSPEQIESAKDVDPRSDIWALGIVLYELLSAQVPFLGETMAEVVFKVIGAQPLPLRQARADVPPALEAIVLRCLEKRREARYPSVAELARDLVGFASRRGHASLERITGLMARAGMPISALPPASSDSVAGQAAVSGPHTFASWERTNPLARRRRGLGAVIGVVSVVALALTGLWLLRTKPAATSNAAPSSSALAPAAELSQPAPRAPAPPPPPTLAPAEEATPAPVMPAAPSLQAQKRPAPAPPARRSKPVAPANKPVAPANKPTPQDKPAAASPASTNPLKMQIE